MKTPRGDMAAPTHVEKLTKAKWADLNKYRKEMSGKKVNVKPASFVKAGAYRDASDKNAWSETGNIRVRRGVLHKVIKKPFVFSVSWHFTGHGTFVSDDGRYIISKAGRLWRLHDNISQDLRTSDYEARSCYGCKIQAERLIQREKYCLTRLCRIVWSKTEDGFASQPEGRFLILKEKNGYSLYDSWARTRNKPILKGVSFKDCFYRADDETEMEKKTGNFGRS